MKITVVIPTYNRASLLPRAIESVLAQSYEDWELIVVDDGSTDDTDKIMSKFNDPRIIYVKQGVNKGVSAARNRGVIQSTGDWVCFLDSDDEYVTDGLSIISEELKKIPADIGMLYFQTENYDGTGRYLGKGGYVPKRVWEYYRPSYEDVLVKKDIKNDMHRCYRADVIRAFPYDEMIKDQDTLMFATMLKNGINCLYVNRSVTNVYMGAVDRISISKRDPMSGYHICSVYFDEHIQVLRKHPELYVPLCMSMTICCIKLRKPVAIFWFIRGFLKSPYYFGLYIKKHVLHL